MIQDVEQVIFCSCYDKIKHLHPQLSHNEILSSLHGSEVAHVKTKSLKDGFVNRPIERYHDEIREKLKARRGLGNDESAQMFTELHKIHHNFVRPHHGLNGKTPAEMTGIDLNLGDDKYLDLIKLSGTKKPNFITNLGKRINVVTIENEGDSIR